MRFLFNFGFSATSERHIVIIPTPRILCRNNTTAVVRLYHPSETKIPPRWKQKTTAVGTKDHHSGNQSRVCRPFNCAKFKIDNALVICAESLVFSFTTFTSVFSFLRLCFFVANREMQLFFQGKMWMNGSFCVYLQKFGIACTQNDWTYATESVSNWLTACSRTSIAGIRFGSCSGNVRCAAMSIAAIAAATASSWLG